MRGGRTERRKEKGRGFSAKKPAAGSGFGQKKGGRFFLFLTGVLYSPTFVHTWCTLAVKACKTYRRMLPKCVL
jgi:hypothetical protein